MRPADFDFTLPPHLIAQAPPAKRGDSRLLLLGGKVVEHRKVADLPSLLKADDLLVMNDTRVYPARLFATKLTGGAVEILVERIVGDSRATCLIKASKTPKIGAKLNLENGGARVVDRDGGIFMLDFDLAVPLAAYLEDYGVMPLPPYINRAVEPQDRHRYQTVYAQQSGAIAAPTAGLHFDESLLQKCTESGIAQTFITLHVGIGTFQPLRDDVIDASQQLHSERLLVSDKVCQDIADVRRRGGRIIAVGTTVVRALETAAADGELRPYLGDTRLFLKPGDPFRVVDGMVTNFHLPQSSLLMLVCAFAGTERVLRGYRQAVDDEYRFFSYGDAMLVFPDSETKMGL